MLCEIKVLILDGCIFLLLELLDLNGGLRVKLPAGRWLDLLLWRSLPPDGDGFTKAVEADETNLLEHVEVVRVTLVEDQLKEHRIGVDVDGLEFPRLEARPLVGVERQIAKSRELYLVQRNLCERSLSARRQERE